MSKAEPGLGGSGIDDTQYTMHSTGDGWLISIDPQVGKPRIVGPVVDRLAAGLRRQNRQADGAGRLRVRLVLHAGDLLLDERGDLVGDQVNLAFRLLDSPQLRVLLKHAAGSLVICVSDAVFRHVVAQRHEGLNPTLFVPVRLGSKRTRGLGWICAPGEPDLATRAGLLRNHTRGANPDTEPSPSRPG
jgi:hypothetical protein